MNQRSTVQRQAKTAPPVQGTVLQRKCACGQHTGGGECAECKEEKRKLQRFAVAPPATASAPPIVHEALRSPGQPLDPGVRAFMESRFGRELNQIKTHSEPAPAAVGGTLLGAGDHPAESEADRIASLVVNGKHRPGTPARSSMADLSHVRIHTDGRAAESARAVGALAYTVGHQIVFGAGQFSPQSSSGRLLLAHELTHVAQQTGLAVNHTGAANPVLRRKGSPELDRIREYLSYGIIDWAITDTDAVEALDLLKRLPRYQKAVFVADRKHFERLRDNLPEERLKELEAIQAEVAAITPSAAVTGDIQKNLSTGFFEFDWAVTDTEAISSLEALKKLSGVELAVALDAVDTETLMEELPEDRKPELQAIIEQVRGTREVAEKTALRSLTFISDHNALLDNEKDFSNSGKPYGEPEWFTEDGQAVSYPISQKKGTPLRLEAILDLMPLQSDPGPMTLRGESGSGYLNFSFSGTMKGGANQELAQPLEARAPIPDAILGMFGREVRWFLNWRGLEYELAKTRHTIYSIMGEPASDISPTEKRMMTAVNLAMAEGPTLPPLELVLRLMNRFKNYNLKRPRLRNPWDLAETSWYGAQCIDIAEFINAVLKVLGCPGKLDVVLISAHPDTPDDVKEEYPTDDPKAKSGTNAIPGKQEGNIWVFAGLLDGKGLWNSFEAAIRFTLNSNTRYFPGGAESRNGYRTPAAVLDAVFDCLAWIEPKQFPGCRIHKIGRSYRQGRFQVGRMLDCQTVEPLPPSPGGSGTGAGP